MNGPTPTANVPEVVTDPLARWDEDGAFRSHLRTVEDPSHVMNAEEREKLRCRGLMLRQRMNELMDLRRTIEEERTSLTIDNELVRNVFWRKVAFWLLFPILDLPPEILTEIFRFAVWSCSSGDSQDFCRGTLTLVNKRFHAIAVGDPMLWNSIWFRNTPPWSRAMTSLRRSGTAILDIRIDDTSKRIRDQTPPSAFTIPQMDAILDAILPKISQIRMIYVELQETELAVRFATRFATAGSADQLARYDLRRLTSVYTMMCDFYDPPRDRLRVSYYPTPRLRKLALTGLLLDWTRFPSANLWHLELRSLVMPICPSSERFSEILEGCPSLFKLTLHSAGPRVETRLSFCVRRVELPNLRELLLGDVDPIYGQYILSHFKAPGVRTLILTDLGRLDYSLLVEFMIGMFPEVRSLTLCRFYVADSFQERRKLIAWYDSMPHVRMLKVTEVYRHVLDAMGDDPSFIWPPEQQRLYEEYCKKELKLKSRQRLVLFPRLESFFFTNQADEDASDFAIRREELGARLKRVYYYGSDPASSSEIAMVRPYVDRTILLFAWEVVSPEEEDLMEENAATVPPNEYVPYARATKKPW